MTLDKAILHEKKLAKEIYIEAMLCHANPDDVKLDNCIEKGRYHEQLVTWLEDLKRRREYDGWIMGSGALNNAYKSGYNKAIDDFTSELKSILPIAVHKDCSEIDYEVDYALYNMKFKIDNVAEQLKTGISND